MNIRFKEGFVQLLAGIPFKQAVGELVVETGECLISGRIPAWEKRGGDFLGDFRGMRIRVECAGGTVNIRLENKTEAGIYVKRIGLVFPPGRIKPLLQAREFLHLVNTVDMKSGTGVKQPGKSPGWGREDESSNMFTLLKGKKGCLLSGTIGGGDGFIDYEIIHDSPTKEKSFGFGINSRIEAFLKPGLEFRTGLIVFQSGTDEIALLKGYGGKLKRVFSPKLQPSATGWNSWDYYAGAVSEADAWENMKSARENFGDKIKYMILDDGWQCQCGVWKANWKFPSGLGGFCSAARASGYIPGIWTAPFLCHVHTPMFREHPEYFARDEAGQPAFFSSPSAGRMGVLDVTRPEVLRHIEEVYSGIKKFGFGYFKLDFLHVLLSPGWFHDRSVGKARLVRLGIEAIRRAVGDESHLVACGAPLESVIGLVNSTRVTADVHNFWGHIRANARAYSCRFWMNGNLWRNDPDFLIVRSKDTSGDFCLNPGYAKRPFYDDSSYWKAGEEMDGAEARAYALFIYLTGGDIILGDALQKLNSKGIGLLRRILREPSSVSAVPLDLFNPRGEIPSVYLMKGKSRSCLGIFNWNESTERFSIDLEALKLTSGEISDFWTGRKISPDRLGDFLLPPRGSSGFVFTD